MADQFSVALASFITGDEHCDNIEAASGGTDEVRCIEPAAAMVLFEAGRGKPHLHFHFGCAAHAQALVESIHMELGLEGTFTELRRAAHDGDCLEITERKG